MKSLEVRKMIDRLARAANLYHDSLGTLDCPRALERLKRAARDYSNSLKVKP